MYRQQFPATGATKFADHICEPSCLKMSGALLN
jgi:hypothetical protein